MMNTGNRTTHGFSFFWTQCAYMANNATELWTTANLTVFSHRTTKMKDLRVNNSTVSYQLTFYTPRLQHFTRHHLPMSLLVANSWVCLNIDWFKSVATNPKKRDANALKIRVAAK